MPLFTLVPIHYSSRNNKSHQQEAQIDEAKEARQRVEAPPAPQQVAGGRRIGSIDCCFCCKSERQVEGGARSACNSSARSTLSSQVNSISQQMRTQTPAIGGKVQEGRTMAAGGRLLVAVGSAPACCLAGAGQQATGIFCAHKARQGYDVATRVAQSEQERPRVDRADGVSVLQIDSERARERLPAAATWQASCEQQTHHFGQRQPLSLIAFKHENLARNQTANTAFVKAHTTATLTTTISVSSGTNQPRASKARPDAPVFDNGTANNMARRQQQQPPPPPPPRMIYNHNSSGTRLAANPSHWRAFAGHHPKSGTQI